MAMTPDLDVIQPVYKPLPAPETPSIEATISALSLLPHFEGGYYAVTDLSPTLIPSPYPPTPLSPLTDPPGALDPTRRRLSTSIFYYLTPQRPLGALHVNRSTIIHSLHRGRGRYVLVHEDGRVESFVVGDDVERGERLMWVVPGGVWKASFLLEDGGGRVENRGLLITETVVPGFEDADQAFLTVERLREMVGEDVAKGLEWLVKQER